MDRKVRVFISSTFRDMQDERERLIKYIFPQLRQFCEKRGVILSEIDLRWGISEEEAAEGKVLSICLSEIDNCRPYFIAILGERYGWIPDNLPESLKEILPADYQGKSATELEILHATFNHKESHSKPFFYFRDPDYLKNLPGCTDPNSFVVECNDSMNKLENLKERIRRSGFKLWENYQTPAELGEKVLQDLTDLIVQDFPEALTSDPEEQNNSAHEIFIEILSKVYVPDPNYFHRLEDHIKGRGAPLAVYGKSGIGKSALLANWVQHKRGRINFSLPERSLFSQLKNLFYQPRQTLTAAEDRSFDLLITHFVGANAQSTEWSALIRRVMLALKKRFDIKLEIPEKPDALKTAFINWLIISAKKGRVLILLDGLDQLKDYEQVSDLAWLPEQLPDNIRLILSFSSDHLLHEIGKRGWQSLQLKPLSVKDRKQFITTYLRQLYGKSFSPQTVDMVAKREQTASPLYLKILLEELRVFGIYERLNERIEHYLRTDTPEDLYISALGRLEEDYEQERPNLVRDSMRLLWASREGLSESELFDLLGPPGTPLPAIRWSALFLAIKESLINRSGLLGFLHQSLQIAVEKKYLQNREIKLRVHRDLADYFTRRELSQRQIEELPWHLVILESWSELQKLLSNRKFLSTAWERYRYEIKYYWTLIEANSDWSMVDTYRETIVGTQMEDGDWAVCALLNDTGHIEEALSISTRLEKEYRSKGDREGLQASLSLRAIGLKNIGKLDDALELLEEQERVCRESSNFSALAACLGNQGVVYRAQGKLADALRLFREEESICREISDLSGLSANLNNQGIIYHDQGDTSRALQIFKDQEKISRQIGDWSGLQKSLGHQAAILKNLGSIKEAKILREEEESLCRKYGDLASLQACLGGLASIYADLADYNKALDLINEREAICKKLNNPEEVARTLNQKAYLFCEKFGHPNFALPMAEEAHKIAVKHGLTKLAKETERLINLIRIREQG